ARCKNIRDEQGRWHKLEQYITERSEAQFSHGICPGSPTLSWLSGTAQTYMVKMHHLQAPWLLFKCLPAGNAVASDCENSFITFLCTRNCWEGDQAARRLTMDVIMGDRRTDRRYSLRLPMKYKILRGRRVLYEGTAHTSNLGRGGVSF